MKGWVEEDGKRYEVREKKSGCRQALTCGGCVITASILILMGWVFLSLLFVR